MIEIVCREGLPEEKEKKICLPKNIRQMGSPAGRHKIYLEDYVYTYLKTLAGKNESCAAIFLGNSQVCKDIRYTFISGALECGNTVFQLEQICMDDSFRESAEREIRQYFPEKEIVGWFLGKKGQAMELTPVAEAAHRKYFSGRDKVLMLMDVLENEEVFFIYDQGYLQKREGYYIYYEKNIPMQEYMISKKEEEQRLEELTELAEAEERTEFAELHRELKAGRETEKQPGTKKAGTQKRPEAEKTRTQEQSETEKTRTQEQSETEKARTQEQSETKKTRTPEQPEEAPQAQTCPEDETVSEQRGKSVQEPSETISAAEAFQELHRELERGTEPGNPEKIFARNNLEEPRTHAEEALESYRNMILERQGRQLAKQNRNFLYTASSFFLVVVCVLGITTINNYRKMQKVEDVLDVMSHVESEGKRSGDENGPVVESVSSQVSPLEEETSASEPGQAGDSQETGTGETAAQGALQPEAAGDQTGQGTPQPGNTDNQAGQEAPQSGNADNQAEQGNTGSQETAEPDAAGTDSSPEAPAEDNTAQETSGGQAAEPRYYTVQPGDTLASICISIYHTKDMMGKVCEVNGIENGDKIYAGQKLLLP